MRVYLSRGKSIDIPTDYNARQRLQREMEQVLNPYGTSMFGTYRKANFDTYDGRMDQEDARRVLQILRGG